MLTARRRVRRRPELGPHQQHLPAGGRGSQRRLATVELRAASLLGTDVVVFALWPEPDDDPAPGEDHPSGMPLEVRCVDQATAVIVEDLARAGPRRPVNRPGPIVLHELIARAERLRRRRGGAAAA